MKHAMTAQLWCHVHNFVLIPMIEFGWEKWNVHENWFVIKIVSKMGDIYNDLVDTILTLTSNINKKFGFFSLAKSTWTLQTLMSSAFAWMKIITLLENFLLIANVFSSQNNCDFKSMTSHYDIYDDHAKWYMHASQGWEMLNHWGLVM